MIAGFRSSLFRSEVVPSQVLCGIHWLLHHLIVGIHARPHHNYDEDLAVNSRNARMADDKDI